MISFWLAIAALTCAAAAALVLPLLVAGRARGAAAASTDEARRLAVYRDRRAEIEAERDAGRMTEDEARRALDELVDDAAVQLPAASEGPQAGPPPRSASASITLAAIAAVAVPLAALVVYAMLGTPGVVGLDKDALRGEATPRALEQAITQLRERVRKSPQDAEAWAMLAQAHQSMGDATAAVPAFERATSLIPNDARLLADYAEALMQTQGGSFAGKPLELLERALKIDPQETKAIAMMGAAQYRLGNREQALGYMRTLQKAMPPGSHEAQRLGEVIAKLESELGLPATAGAGDARAGGSAVAGGPSAAAGASSITGTVTIDDALRAEVPPGSTLFVVARGSDGSPVPLAALRLAVSQWPVKFELSDAQAMNSARLLSQARGVVLEARISRSGAAGRQSGDVFGTSAEIGPGARDVVVRIDQRVP